jgi:hypothetical protein
MEFLVSTRDKWKSSTVIGYSLISLCNCQFLLHIFQDYTAKCILIIPSVISLVMIIFMFIMLGGGVVIVILFLLKNKLQIWPDINNILNFFFVAVLGF